MTAWIPVIVYAAGIFILSHQERLPWALPPWDGSDKIVHGAVYAGFALLAWRAFGASRPSEDRLGQGIAALMLTALYAASDEWHQSFVPGRCGDLWDWIADVVGGGISVLLVSGRRGRSLFAVRRRH